MPSVSEENKVWLRNVSKLESLAKAYADRPWNYQPTVRHFARRLKVRQSDIVAMAEESESLDLIVGVRSGAGTGPYRSTGDYQVEYVKSDDEVEAEDLSQ